MGAVTLLSLVGYLVSPRIRERLGQVPYDVWMKLIGLFSGFSILGALVYQYLYLSPVCPLCWWQRIFIFPIAIVAAVSVATRTQTNHFITGIMGTLGLLFASYHYYGHFQKYVLGNPFLIPCSTSALEPSCSESPIIIFDFITIPFMGMLALSAIVWLSYLAYQKSQQA
ncbi:MAG: disulfide bond formation protein B [Candidatus Moranbacteria bacterium]|nr:disulfide bond formation protein B [Candidatus Moranbacteria bacterium]